MRGPILDRHFSTRVPAGRFAAGVVVVSLGALVPVLWVYVALTPGFWGHLVATQGARAPFLRQIATNGVPVVVVVNAAALILFAWARAGRLAPGAALGLDLGLRVALFAGLHGVVFAASAVVFGAFGGDVGQALGALGPTLRRAAVFGNLAGVYLWATLLCALPLHMVLIAQALGRPVGAGLLPALGLGVLHLGAVAAVGGVLARLL